MSVNSPKSRLVLLGASNLTRGIAAVLRQAQARLEGPFDVMAALGLGRSYGMKSSVGPRVIPGTLNCALWRDLAERPPLPTYALIADIGNDIAYGVEADRVCVWLEECLNRLKPYGPRTIMVQLPTENLSHLTAAQYRLLRHFYFSRHQLGLDVARLRAKVIAGRVEELAKIHAATLVDQPRDWYGFDPIHYPIRHWDHVWGEILADWGPTPHNPMKTDPKTWFYLRRVPPAQRWFLGREYRAEQPAGALPDGTRLSFY